jgi:hypothetical protein
MEVLVEYQTNEIDLYGQPPTSTGPGGSSDWDDITNKPATFAPSAHNHDDRYYTEAEVTALLAALDLFSGDYPDLTNIPATFAPSAHNHDDRYYTEAEVTALLAANKLPKIAPTPGDYYSAGGQSSAATPGITIAGKIVAHPIYLDAGTLDRIAVSTSGAGASIYRLGLYKADPVTGLPDGQTPFLDAGTVDMSATAGVQQITISKVITEPGLYWAVVLCDSYTAQPATHNLTYSSNSAPAFHGLPQDMSSLGRYRVGRTHGSALSTGALPATFPSTNMSWLGTCPRVAVRYV